MKFSAQEEYGLRCLIAIARRGPDSSLTIPEISKEEGLTPSHVAKLLAILRKAGYIKSTRGQQGGYTIAKSTHDMKLQSVLECLGGRLFHDGFCERHSGIEEKCVHESECLLRPVWSNIQIAVDAVIGRFTVGDVMDGSIPMPIEMHDCRPTAHVN